MQRYALSLSLVLVVIGLACGVAGQIELLQPELAFFSQRAWITALPVHRLALLAGLGLCVLATLPALRHRAAWGEWAVWGAAALFCVAAGVYLTVFLQRISAVNSSLHDTVFMSARWHAFGLAFMMVAIGGVSAGLRSWGIRLSALVSLMFAAGVLVSGGAMVWYQAQLGFMGVPAGYIDYPSFFTAQQQKAGYAGLACLGVMIALAVRMWAASRKAKADVQTHVVGAF